MLKLIGSHGAYRVVDSQTGAVVLNVAEARYTHRAGEPPMLSLDVFGGLIDAGALVAGETCRIVGDGRNTEVEGPDGYPLANVASVEVTAGPSTASGVVRVRDVFPETITVLPPHVTVYPWTGGNVPDPPDETAAPEEPIEAMPPELPAEGSPTPVGDPSAVELDLSEVEFDFEIPMMPPVLEGAPADPTDAASEGGNDSEPSNSGDAEVPRAFRGRWPRG